MIRAARPHYLRGNKGERTPPRIIVLDTESRIMETEPREVQGLRCWVAQAIHRNEGDDEPRSRVTQIGTNIADLLEFVEWAVSSKSSWRLFTHNLSYDLGLTRLPLALLNSGWTLGRHNLASEAPWAYFKKGGRGLWLCDSWSWLPESVERLGERVGIAKPALPTEDDDDDAWIHRCRVDVEVVATALLRLMAEWDRRRLGWWSITGPASGWNTMLHFPNRSGPQPEGPHVAHSANPRASTGSAKTLIVPDPQARAFERLALYSGRRDVWKTGKISGGPFAEVDLKQAHLTICAHLPLPYRRWAPFSTLALDDWRLENSAAGLIAEVVLDSHAPRYPLRLKGAILHPVGKFATVLAGPEIADARSRGELVSIGRGYGYHLGHVMRDWAQWALAVLADDGSEVEPLLQVAVKGWSRSVPGRWGMTHAREIKSGESYVQDWALEPITVGNPPRRGSIFHLAGRWTESVNDQEADDSFPAVLAYVQSYCRLALNRMLDTLDPEAIVSCNTEGAWIYQWGYPDSPPKPDPRVLNQADIDALSISRLVALNQATAPLTVRIKQTARHLQVLSPQHHRADDRRLYSGIPRAAVEVAPERFAFQTWPKLRGQIERGDPRGYIRERRTVNLAGVPVSRWSFEDGWCEPVAVAWSPETGNVIQPPRAELEAHHGALRPVQHPALRGALTAGA